MLTSISPFAQSQNTVQAHQFRFDSCEIVAKRASNAYKFKENGSVYPRHTIPTSSPISVLHRWAVDYALKDASSQEDAIKTSFAKCMDNIDRVYRDARSGVGTKEDDLQ